MVFRLRAGLTMNCAPASMQARAFQDREPYRLDKNVSLPGVSARHYLDASGTVIVYFQRRNSAGLDRLCQRHCFFNRAAQHSRFVVLMRFNTSALFIALPSRVLLLFDFDDEINECASIRHKHLMRHGCGNMHHVSWIQVH